MVRRNAILGLAALIAASGCNAGTSGGLRRQESPAVARENLTKSRIIAQHNKNAATIQSLRANPSIVVAADGQKGKLSGRMAMEREKDFRLEISSTMHKQADIGSNATGFWFWVKDSENKALYHCNYDQVNASPLAVTMQPDWIIEAMGLREIGEREAATISASPGDKPGQLVLTQLRKDPKGGSLTKITVVDEATGEIREHQLWSGAKEKLLARATISQTQAIAMREPGEGGKEFVVRFPARIQLVWEVENFSLDINMGVPTINPNFAQEQRLVLFTEPKISGAVRTDLAKLNAPPASASSRIHESDPRPGLGVRLGNPEVDPAGFEGADVRPSPAADLPPLPSTGYIGPQVPRAPDPNTIQTSAGPNWNRATFR